MVVNMTKAEAQKQREYTSFRVQPEIWKEVKITAIKQDVGVSDLAENALETYLELLENKSKGDKELLEIVKKRLGL